MYEWLEKEIQTVQTRKFFLINEVRRTRSDVRTNLEGFPLSYVEFIRKFGKSRFFRDDTGCYSLGVLNNPEKLFVDKAEFWRIGWYEGHYALLKPESGGENTEWPVYEQNKFGSVRRVAETFDEWLCMVWKTVRGEFSPRKWKRIVEGPPPFSHEEMAVVNARRKFSWRLIDIDSDCTLHFEVTNESDRRLPYIGVEAHGKKRGVWVGLALRVDHIMPGTTGHVEHRGMQPLGVSPDEIEVFEEEEPGPEDRKFYWEFRSLPD